MRKGVRLGLMIVVSVLLPLICGAYYFAQGRYYLGALGVLVALINCLLQWRRRVPIRFNQVNGGHRG